MSEQPQKASLSDMLTYKPEEYLSIDEISMLKSTFGNNPKLMKLLRKVLLPVVEDPELPLEDFGKDSFIIDKDWSQIPEQHIKSLVVARQDTMKFILGGLIKLKVIANSSEESDEERANRLEKDSNK